MHVYKCLCIVHKYKSKSVHLPNTKYLGVQDDELLFSATAHSSPRGVMPFVGNDCLGVVQIRDLIAGR